MAHEFFLLAINETQNWDPDYLARFGTVAAFGIYLIKNGERTHCCSLTPSSWGVFIANEFILEDYDLDDFPEDDSSDDGSNYFGFTPHNPLSPFHSPLFKIDGRFSSERAWREAEEEARTNPDFPLILTRSNFEAYEAQQLAKAHAENRAPCRSPMLPLFALPGQAMAYEQLKTLHWI